MDNHIHNTIEILDQTNQTADDVVDLDIVALEAEYDELTARQAEAFDICNNEHVKLGAWVAAREARNVFLAELALTPSSDPDVVRAKARIWAAMKRHLDDTLSFPIEAAVEPDDDGIVRLDDALARSIARDVCGQPRTTLVG